MGTQIRVFRPKAVADRQTKDGPLLEFAEMVVAKITNNPNFTSPGTVLTDLAAATTAFGTALTNKGTQKDVGNALASARQNLVDKITHTKDYVNGCSEKAPADQAKAIIESSGFRVRKVVVRTKLPVDVKYGPNSGTAVVDARAVARDAVYFFQVSTDQKTWASCGQIMKCKTTVTGLIPGTTYYFRVQAQTRKGLVDWTAPVGIVMR